MAIICAQTAVVGYTSALVCNKLARIDNIQPTFPDRADLILEGQYASAYTSGSALRRGNEIWTLFLLSKNVPGGTVNIKLTISSDPCAGAACPDKCIGSDLWSYRCDPKYENLVPVGYECVQDSLKQANSPACVAPAAPTYAVEFKTFENMLGILGFLSHYTGMLTSGINRLIPQEAGWSVHSTEIDSSRGVIRLLLSETGSWNLTDVIIFLLTAIALAISAICFLLLPTTLGIALGVIALVIASYSVIRLIDRVSVLEESVNNFRTKDQNDVRLDQMVANVLDQYEKSSKTKDNCLNKLNGLKSAYVSYLDVMQKNFANLYTPAMKRTFAATVDSAIEQFKAGTITCERATEIILTQGGIAKSDLSTNFSTVYNINNPYVPPKKEDCWISKPIGEGCLLSASTGQWIVGTIIAVAGLGVAYWAITRKPEETKIVIERVKEEAERAREAIRKIRAPAVPRITGAPAAPRITGAPVAV